MDLSAGYYYHIYNRGNNSRNIFYKRENYLYFLKKMKDQLSPFVSVVAWCLMPNHFHWVVFVNKERVKVQPNKDLPKTVLNSDHKTSDLKELTLNYSIGVLLRSYTRAIQNQENIQGSLFQQHTQAKVLTDEIRIEPGYWNTAFGTQINIVEGKSYLETCIDYVHQNPSNNGLVEQAQNWEFSSFRDYLQLRKGKLLDYNLLIKEGLLPDFSDKYFSDTMTQSHRITEIKNVCIIGIGSNIEAETNIAKMLEILQTKVEVVKVSRLLKTKPIGIIDQADFTNGAVKVKTECNQTELNKILKNIEDQMGRDRTNPKFGPRCIDLDIAVWNDKIVDEDYFSRDFLKNSVDELME